MIPAKRERLERSKKVRVVETTQPLVRTIDYTQTDKLYDSGKAIRHSWDDTKRFLEETYNILRIEGVITDETSRAVMSKMKRFDNVMTNTIRLLTKLQQYYDF
jgi:hypothetical protein